MQGFSNLKIMVNKYRHFRWVLAVIWVMVAYQVTAQIQYEGKPAAIEYALEDENLPRKVIRLDARQELINKQLAGVYIPGEPMHAGFAIASRLNPRQEGQWQVVADSLHVWRIHLRVPGSLGVGVNFDAFQLGDSSRFFAYDPLQKVVLGAFDHRNNNPQQVFATHIIPGEEVILEYQEPYYAGKVHVLQNTLFSIESVISISYGGELEIISTKNLGATDTLCFVNINCPEGNDWQDEKRGIARMLMRVGNSYSWCTGTLINNTALDQRPYFLTAEHCGRNANDHDLLYWQFYFNFERPGCDTIGIPPNHMILGATLRALGPLTGGSDFRLLELSQIPPPHWRPYWNGWDRRTQASPMGVGIHHPSGDAKKISTYTLPAENSSPFVSGQQMAPNSAWRVRWSPTVTNHSVTAGGSSGSPLFNNMGLVVGSLTGGSSNCNNPTFPDYYGKFSYHWSQNGPQPHQQLAGWLDPLQTGQLTLEALDPFADEYPPPGYLQATKETNTRVTLSWYPPGSFPNPEGWFFHVTSSSHLSWAGPERATVFEAPVMGMSYPLTLSSVSHVFVEHSEHQWPDNRFRFVIYDSDATSVLYESPVLTAVHNQQILHELSTPIVFNNYFYVAVRPLDESGHPSSLMQQVNFDQGYSFLGAADDFRPYLQRPTTQNPTLPWLAYTFLTGIYVEPGPLKQAPVASSVVAAPTGEVMHTAQSNTMAEIIMQPPDSYRLYRDNDLIFTSQDQRTFTETLPMAGLFRYYVTAVYNDTESAPSNMAYVLIPLDCPEVINQWPYQQVFDSGFDPLCWITHSDAGGVWQLTSGFSWQQAPVEPVAGEQFYVINPQADQATDGWLIIPRLDFSALDQPVLRFNFNGALLNEEDNFRVMVSVAGQSFVPLWESRQHAFFEQGNRDIQWQEATIDLQHLGNLPDVRIGFQFIGQGDGFAAVDNIRIIPAQGIRYTLNINVIPDSPLPGMAFGRGQYLEGETVTVIADPNVARLFDAWLVGGNVVSEQPVYQFLMPSNNLTLTARFVDDPTDVPEVFPERKTLAEAFPNPTRTNIRLRFYQNLQSANLLLMDARGQLIKQIQLQDIFPGNEHEISLQHLPQGMYFIHLHAGSSQQLIKVVRSNY